MRIVIGLYYYYPYVSGLSVTTRHMAEELTSRGHEVCIVTSRFDPALESREAVNGVEVRRADVWFRMDKGVFMPGFVPLLLSEGRKADVVNLHLPMAEASLLCRTLSQKTVLMYHCDPRLNHRGWLGRMAEATIYASLRSAVGNAAATVAHTFDYAANSRVLADHLEKLVVIPPPVRAPARPATSPVSRREYFQQRAGIPPGARTIGFLGRIVYEKGLDFLVNAFRDLQLRHDDVYLLVAGDYQSVAGGSVRNVLFHFLEGRDLRIGFTGRLTDAEVDDFLRFIDVLALPSIDPLEAYGLVQVEAMLRGTPVVATDLPGVRTIVQRTGMGLIVPRRDPHALAIALEKILYEGPGRHLPPDEVLRLLEIGDPIGQFEALFERVRKSCHAERGHAP
jgi:glycosyltransferase involved in cell wall biosynthesis